MGDLKTRLVSRALQEGFVAARICRPDSVPDVPGRLAAFVEAGYHGQMGWLEERMQCAEILRHSGRRRVPF